MIYCKLIVSLNRAESILFSVFLSFYLYNKMLNEKTRKKY